MAYLGEFNPSDVPPDEYELVPPGLYQACIVASDIKETKNGRGKYINLQLEIQVGEYSGRKVFDRLNLWNENETAVKIAQQSLVKIIEAVNAIRVSKGSGMIHTLRDTEELHFFPMIIDVRVKRGEGEYSDSNEVKSYKPVPTNELPLNMAPPGSNTVPSAPVNPPAPASPPPTSGPAPAPAAPAAAGGFPWQRR